MADFVIDADGHIMEDHKDIFAHTKGNFSEMNWHSTWPMFDADGWQRGLARKGKREDPDAEAWVRFQDEHGIDCAVLYPTSALAIGMIQLPAWASAIAQGYNDWLYHRFISQSSRLKGVALLAPQDPKAAAAELRRCVKDLGFCAGLLPSVTNNRTPLYGSPVFHEIYDEAQRLDVPLTIHGGVSQNLGLDRMASFLEAHMLAQSDFNRQPAQRRADSDEAGSEYRLYEIAGAAHSGPFPAGQPATADLSRAGFEAPDAALCVEDRSEFPLGYAFNAIWQQFAERLDLGTPMMTVPRIEVDAAAAPVPDANGNAQGGWRLPQIDVPLAAYAGVSTPRDGDARAARVCALTGAVKRYDQVRLKQMYRDRGEYLRRFNAAVDLAVQERRLVSEDAAPLKAATARSVSAF